MSGRNTSRGVTRGRQRVPLDRIENEVQRLVTFSKRRTGLFKKASEISTLCGTEIAMVVFSPSGKPFSFGNPDMNRVLTKYFGEIPNREANVPEHIIRAHQEAKMRAMTSQINVLEAQIDEEKMVDQALREAEKGRPSISDLQLPELQLMKQKMETLLIQVTEKLNMFSIMEAQSQAMETRFGANDGAGPSGVTRGRQRVPLDRIENEVQRLVTFSKRRTGLFKKASEISTLCGTEIAMVVFSPSGKPFSFGNPDMNRVLTKYFGEIPNREANVPEHIIRAHQEAKMRAMTSQINVLEAQIDEEKMVEQALREAEKGRPSISDLQLPELQLMKQKMETLLIQVTEKLNMFSIMEAQSQAMETRFGANDGAGPSGV
nr:agamous-like MADS-box protein AGL61 [Ipomoea batatas]